MSNCATNPPSRLEARSACRGRRRVLYGVCWKLLFPCLVYTVCTFLCCCCYCSSCSVFTSEFIRRHSLPRFKLLGATIHFEINVRCQLYHGFVKFILWTFTLLIFEGWFMYLLFPYSVCTKFWWIKNPRKFTVLGLLQNLVTGVYLLRLYLLTHT